MWRRGWGRRRWNACAGCAGREWRAGPGRVRAEPSCAGPGRVRAAPGRVRAELRRTESAPSCAAPSCAAPSCAAPSSRRVAPRRVRAESAPSPRRVAPRRVRAESAPCCAAPSSRRVRAELRRAEFAPSPRHHFSGTPPGSVLHATWRIETCRRRPIRRTRATARSESRAWTPHWNSRRPGNSCSTDRAGIAENRFSGVTSCG